MLLLLWLLAAGLLLLLLLLLFLVVPLTFAAFALPVGALLASVETPLLPLLRRFALPLVSGVPLPMPPVERFASVLLR